MANVTLSIDNELLNAGRKYAQEHNTSLNALIRKLLESEVNENQSVRLDELLEAMKKSNGNSRGKKWTREGLLEEQQ